MRNCRTCNVRLRALCGVLPAEALQKLSRVGWRRQVRAGSTVMGDEEAKPVVANLVDGVVRLSKSLPDGRVQIVGLLFPGAFIGRPLVEPANCFVEAATDTELCVFPRSHFEALLDRSAGAREFLMQRAAEELEDARGWMMLLGRKSAEERVASLLLHIAERGKVWNCGGDRQDGAGLVEMPHSRTEMALHLGLTLETVGRMMKRLELAGIISCRSKRRIVIDDWPALRARAEGAPGGSDAALPARSLAQPPKRPGY